jgi:murein biosynthesis integral membrane protein MurJ
MIIKNSILLAFFAGISTLLGVLRDRLLAEYVGIGSVLDIYNASFRLPDFLYSLSLAFITAGTVIPFLTAEDKHGHLKDSRHKLSSVALFFAGSISLLGGIIALTVPLYAKYIVPGFTDDQIEVFISTTRVLMIQPFFLGLSSLIACFAQIRNQFLLYGVAPLGYSLSIIGGVVFLYPKYGPHGLIYGVVVGCVVSLVIQLFSLRNTKMIEVLPYFSWKDIKELVSLGLPRTGTNVLTQLRIMFFTAFATTLGPGVLTSYLFAQKITDAVIVIVQQSVTTASLPVLSKEYIENRLEEYAFVVKKYVFLLGVAGAFISTIIFFMKEDVIWILYGETGANESIAFFLNGFLIALPLYMMAGYFTIGLYSMKDTKSVLYSNFLGTISAIAVCYYFQSEGAISLVYGVITMVAVNFIFVSFMYAKKKFT